MQEDTSTAFNAEADKETKTEALQALKVLMSSYTKQSDILSQVVRGATKYTNGSTDKVMADKLKEHLAQLSCHIHVQSLICARLDGVDVSGVMTEIEQFINKIHPSPLPKSPAPGDS